MKIDRSFVHDLNDDEEDRELVTAAISMAQVLGLNVVAEGIETEEQLAFLKNKRCDLGQGFYFSKPLTPQAFEALLKNSV